MGMFDEVHYEGEVLQTKQFDCEMDQYWIEGGRLLKTTGYFEFYPDAGSGSMGGCGPVGQFIVTGRDDTNFHGMLYAGEKVFKFTDGSLVGVIKEGDCLTSPPPPQT